MNKNLVMVVNLKCILYSQWLSNHYVEEQEQSDNLYGDTTYLQIIDQIMKNVENKKKA